MLQVGQKILVVDNDVATREGIAALLAHDGYVTFTAHNVPAALEALNAHHPDLLITDIRMDAYNGLHIIAMAPEPIPAIVITGFADPGIEADAVRMGADYLVKPVEPAVLRQTVARKLASAAEAGVFREVRREVRRPVSRSPELLLEQHPTRLLDVSPHGARLEVQTMPGVELPSSTILRVLEASLDVPIEIVWKRRVGDDRWLCGAAIVEAAASGWQTVIDTV